MRVASEKGQKTTTEDGCVLMLLLAWESVRRRNGGKKRINIPVNKQKMQKVTAEGVGFVFLSPRGLEPTRRFYVAPHL
jgi:hypothetical protein